MWESDLVRELECNDDTSKVIDKYSHFTAETSTKIDTVISKIDAVNTAQAEQKRINEEIIGLRQTDIDKEQAAYDAHKKTMDMYKEKLLELDNILKTMTRTITIDLKVNGMEQINAIQGFVGQATSPMGAATGRQDYGDYYTQGGKTYWNNGTLADSGTSFVIPGAATGGHVEKGGLVRVHDNEDIVAAKINRSANISGQGGGSIEVKNIDVSVHVYGVTGPSAISDQIANSLALKLTPALRKIDTRHI